MRVAPVALAALLGSFPATALAAPAAPAPQSAPSAQPAMPKAPIAISNLVVRLDRDQIGLAGSDYRIHLIERLREKGFNAVGAENLVFDKDESRRAEYRLGGIIRELECHQAPRGLRCRLGIEWQLLDESLDAVVYTALTRSFILDAPPGDERRMAYHLLIAALDNLLLRERFRQILAAPKSEAGPADPAFSAATFGRCAPIGKRMPEAAEGVLQATVVVRTRTGFGSGFFVSSDGLIMTAAHAVDAPRVTVRLRSGEETEAVPVRVARNSDVALLRLTTPKGAMPCLATSTRPTPSVGVEVYAAGAPADLKLAFSLTRGIVSGVRELFGRTVLQTDAPISPGNSGGPLVDLEATAVAVTRSKLAGGRVEGVAFGVPIDRALAALSLAPGSSTDPALLSAVSTEIEQPAPAAFADIPDMIPSLDPEGDAWRAREAASNEQRRQSQERERLARESMRRRETERDSLTPRYVKAMKWGGLGVALVSGTVAVVTYNSYDSKHTTRSEFDSLKTWNAVGWLGFGIGAGAFTASYLLRPALPADPRAPKPPGSTLSIGPGSVRWEGSF